MMNALVIGMIFGSIFTICIIELINTLEDIIEHRRKLNRNKEMVWNNFIKLGK